MIKADANDPGKVYIVSNSLAAITLLDTDPTNPESRDWSILRFPDNLTSPPVVASATSNPASFTPPAVGESYVVQLVRTLVAGSETLYLAIIVEDADGYWFPCPGLDATPGSSLLNATTNMVELGWAGGASVGLKGLSAQIRKARTDALAAGTPASTLNAGTQSIVHFNLVEGRVKGACLSVLEFGAKGYPIDDSIAFVNAVAAANAIASSGGLASAGDGCTLTVPRGVFICNSPLAFGPGVKFQGEGLNATQIISTLTGGNTNADHFVWTYVSGGLSGTYAFGGGVSGINLRAGAGNLGRDLVVFRNRSNVVIEDVLFGGDSAHTRYVLLIEGALQFSITNAELVGGNVNLRIGASTAVTSTTSTCDSVYCSGAYTTATWGLTGDGGDGARVASYGLDMRRCVFESNAKRGLVCETGTMQIDHPYFESNGDVAMDLGTISGGDSPSHITVLNPFFSPASYDPAFVAVRTQYVFGGALIGGNFGEVAWAGAAAIDLGAYTTKFDISGVNLTSAFAGGTGGAIHYNGSADLTIYPGSISYRDASGEHLAGAIRHDTLIASSLSAAPGWSQTQRSGTGANAGTTALIKGQKGQQQTGGAANNDGALITFEGGDPGTGGSGAAGKRGWFRWGKGDSGLYATVGMHRFTRPSTDYGTVLFATRDAGGVDWPLVSIAGSDFWIIGDLTAGGDLYVDTAGTFRVRVPGGSPITATATAVTFGAAYSAGTTILTAAATVNVDLSLRNSFVLTMNQNTTFTFSNPKEGARYTLIVIQDAAHTLTWPGADGSHKYENGVTPAAPVGAGNERRISIDYINSIYYIASVDAEIAGELASDFQQIATDQSLTSTSFADLLSSTITTAAGHVDLHFTASASTLVAAATIQLVIDGSAQAGTQAALAAAISGNLAITFRATVTAASHTFKVQYKVATGGTLQIRPTSQAEHANFVVQEVP